MIFVYSLAIYGLIESLRKTYEMYQDCYSLPEIVVILVLNVLTFGMFGYIIKLGIEFTKGL